VVSLGGGDVVVAGQLRDPDHEVSERGHDAGTVSGPDLGSVFAETDVTDVVEASMLQRLQPAIWAGVASWTARPVTA
jgi:hypothetical protein